MNKKTSVFLLFLYRYIYVGESENWSKYFILGRTFQFMHIIIREAEAHTHTQSTNDNGIETKRKFILLKVQVDIHTANFQPMVWSIVFFFFFFVVVVLLRQVNLLLIWNLNLSKYVNPFTVPPCAILLFPLCVCVCFLSLFFFFFFFCALIDNFLLRSRYVRHTMSNILWCRLFNSASVFSINISSFIQLNYS